MKIVFLIGYMGSGKSTLGKQVADILNCTYLDTDTEIEKIHQTSINKLIKTNGETWFRNEEQAYLSTISNLNYEQNSILIVSCGGGFPCFNDMISKMNSIGTTVYLKLSAQSLYNRLILERDERPLLNDLTENELLEKISFMLNNREPIYSLANYTIELDNKNKDEALEALRFVIKKVLD